MKDISRYAITFKYNGETFVLTYFEWKTGKLSDGAWPEPRFTFVPTKQTSFSKVKLFKSVDEAAEVIRQMFIWDDGYDCAVKDYIYEYETYKSGKTNWNKLIYKVTKSEIKIKRMVFKYDHCEDVS